MEWTKRTTNEIGILFLVFLFFTVLTLFQTGLKIDEAKHHLPLLIKLHQNSLLEIITGPEYPAANPPLPYLINLAFHKIFFIEPGIISARIFTSLISFVTGLLMYFLARKLGSTHPLPVTLIIILYPYFLKPAFTFYMAVYGLCFFLCFWLIFEKTSQRPHHLMTAGIVLAGAILSQQFYIAIIPAAFLFIALRKFNSRSKNPSETQVQQQILSVTKQLTFLVIPVLVLSLPVFLSWGGLTHIHYRFHTIAFDSTNITSILIAAGGFLFPISLLSLKKITKIEYIFYSLFAIGLVLFFYPEWTIKAGRGRITGMSFHFAELAERIHFIAGYVVKILLLISGFIIIGVTFRKILRTQYRFGVLAVTFFITGYVFNEFLAERHLLPLIVTLYLLNLNEITNKRVLWTWATLQGIAGIIYYSYYLFIQKNWPIQL
ncbi:MAG: glycosyltransferase family 39 protein [Ignavibacteriaceae bacterium]|nr:glycosyltransferase family 39 protein [Ignavibacteriaceae bacterium]